MMKHFISTRNPITLKIFSNSYLYQSKLDYLTYPAILKFSLKYLYTILNQSGYNYKYYYKALNNENANKSKSYKSRKRNIISFNSPFSKNLSNNTGKYFILFFFQTFVNQLSIYIIKK